jgi:two-component system chemotaxis response regulator CheB
MDKRIKVLIIDDSPVFREVLSLGLSMDAQIQIVAKAEHPFDAAEKIEKYQPDVITCDVEMPKMDGIEFIRQLIPQHPVPVIVVSSVSGAVFDAMNAGAVDFLTKPKTHTSKNVNHFMDELIHKIKQVSKAKIINTHSVPAEMEQSGFSSQHEVIAIGASTGGTESIFQILKALPPNMPGIVIVQHIPPVFSKIFAERLNAQTGFHVTEGKTGDEVIPGRVIIAPGDQHMVLKRMGDRLKVEVFQGDKVNGHCPSVDVLFESVSKCCGDRALGVILTGMGYDGAKGLLAMRRRGARTLGQDEASSVVYGMPKAAFEVGAVETQCTLSMIPRTVCKWLR